MVSGMAAPSGRALVIRIGALGDVLLTRRLTYSLSLTGYRSTLFAPARHAAVLKSDPWIDSVLDSESPFFGSAFWGEWPDLREGDHSIRRFDLALVISRSGDLSRFAAARSAKVARIQPDPAKSARSIARQWAEAAADWAPPFAGDLPLLPTDAGLARLEGSTLIHPGSGSLEKNWPADRFAALSTRLATSGHRVVWIRGPAEAPPPTSAVAFTELTGLALPALAATLARALLFIGNDSGVSHLAAAVGASTLALFGPTDPAIWSPDGPRVQTIRAVERRMAHLSVGDVVARCGDGFGPV